MTATPIIDPDVFLHEQLAQASPDAHEARRLAASCVVSPRPGGPFSAVCQDDGNNSSGLRGGGVLTCSAELRWWSPCGFLPV